MVRRSGRLVGRPCRARVDGSPGFTSHNWTACAAIRPPAPEHTRLPPLTGSVAITVEREYVALIHRVVHRDASAAADSALIQRNVIERRGRTSTQTDHQVTRLIEALRAGDDAAFDRMLPLVYDELRRIAHRQLGGQGAGLTLNTTALVHESYLKLVGGSRLEWSDRAHFFAVAARAMRHILIDHARKHRTAKRGGHLQRVSLDEAAGSVEAQADALLALDQALERLAALDERLRRVVECRFFGGMTEDETATALGVTPRTVRRDWLKARMWLYAELSDDADARGSR